MASTFPDQPSDELAQFHNKWKRTRTVLLGSTAVKDAREEFLPRASSTQNDKGYEAYLKRVVFLPMASSINSRILGLMMRKDPVCEDNGVLSSIIEVLTRCGMNHPELSGFSAQQMIGYDYGALVVDADPAPLDRVRSKAEAEQDGTRAWIAPYSAFNVLECRMGAVRGHKKPVYARLRDSADKVRELELVNGVYTVTIHERINKQVQVTKHTPTVNGKTLDEIPLVLLNRGRGALPDKAEIDDIIELNLSHYAQGGMLDSAMLYSSAPITYVTGFTPPMKQVTTKVRDPDTGELTDATETVKQSIDLSVEPGVTWQFGGKDTKVAYHEYSGKGIDHIMKLRTDVEDKVSELSGGFWTREKASVEAAETLRIRAMAQNARVASIANVISDRIATVLRMLAQWQGTPNAEIRYQMNTDYLPIQMTSTEITARHNLVVDGLMSRESLFYALRDGDVYDAALTWEMEQARLKKEQPARDAEAAKALAVAAATSKPADDQSQAS